jgi:hypothetical protein
MIVGVVLGELPKVVQRLTNLSFYKAMYCTLATNFYTVTRPTKVDFIAGKEFDEVRGRRTIAIPDTFTEWDCEELRAPMTIAGLCAYVLKEYNVKIDFVMVGKLSLYNRHSRIAQSILPKTIEGRYEELTKKKLLPTQKSLHLEINGTFFGLDYDAILRPVKYLLIPLK